jgi:site-specific DNA-methyltransferase (adenine-specific)
MKLNTINLSDNIEFIKSLPDNSIDAIITDSPYGLGKKQNLVKLLQAWVTTGYYEITGTGFMGKKWDAFVPQPILWKECLRVLKPGGYLLSFFGTRTYHLGSLAIELAGFEIRDCIQWIYGSGFPKSKSCLKPANEPICVARKPGPVQLLNIDECRIEVADNDKGHRPNWEAHSTVKTGNVYGKFDHRITKRLADGRYPTNIIIDEDVAIQMDEQSGISGGDRRTAKFQTGTNGNFTTAKAGQLTPCYNDKGGASRFFYVAKASPSERAGATHPTIKPVKLMTQLVKLYCPEGGVVLDPHNGTGPTCEACLETGRNYIGIDNDPVSQKEANERIKRWHKKQSNTILKETA